MMGVKLTGAADETSVSLKFFFDVYNKSGLKTALVNLKTRQLLHQKF
jgi:hypothetical protein